MENLKKEVEGNFIEFTPIDNVCGSFDGYLFCMYLINKYIKEMYLSNRYSIKNESTEKIVKVRVYFDKDQFKEFGIENTNEALKWLQEKWVEFLQNKLTFMREH